MNLRTTQTGPRPDLGLVEVNWPLEFIGPMLFPIMNTSESSGTFTYRGIVADAAPVENRAWNASLAQTQITNETASFTCVKQEKRYVMREDEVKECGGIENAEKIMAGGSKRSVMRKFEDDAYAAIFTSGRRAASIELASGKEFGVLNEAANGVRRVKGALSLVCNQQWILGFLGLSAVATRLQSVGGLGAYIAARDAALGLQKDVVVSMLRTILPFEQILIGDDIVIKLVGFGRCPRGQTARLGITAPLEVPVDREVVRRRIEQEGRRPRGGPGATGE